jgi:hypothetical protein
MSAVVNLGSSSGSTNPINLRCFVEIQSLINQNPSTVSQLGELSALSLSYSTTISESFSSSLTGFRLVSFNCVNPGNSAQVPVPQYITDLSINLVSQALAYSASHQLPFVAQNFIDTLTANNSNIATNIQIGSFITETGVVTLPEWISYTYAPDGSQIKIWLCDQSFQQEYDLYQIVVVPPITPIDTFFQTIGVVQNAVSAVTPSMYIAAIQAAKGIYPETALEAYTFNYYSPIVGNTPIPTTWTAIIYGQAGNNIDSVKAAIQAYIANNTSNTIANWQAIFPDIYKQTEFIIIPRWDKYAIPQATTISGLYSSMTNPQTDINFAVSKVPFYPASFVQQNITVMTHYYKYITLLVVNGQNNVAGSTNIEAIFPDYIPQSSNSLDFNRMTPATQQWSNLLEQMLMIAETMTDLSAIPTGFRRVYRNNVLFLASTLNNIDYLMAVKSTY